MGNLIQVRPTLLDPLRLVGVNLEDKTLLNLAYGSAFFGRDERQDVTDKVFALGFRLKEIRPC